MANLWWDSWTITTIECECYFDKNGKPLNDEESIRYLTNGEPKLCADDVIERYEENGNFLSYADYDDSPCYYIYNDKYDYLHRNI